MILVRTDHPFLRVGHHTCKLTGGGRRSPESLLGHRQLGERKINNEVKAIQGHALYNQTWYLGHISQMDQTCLIV
jgi:hypothetical protein